MIEVYKNKYVAKRVFIEEKSKIGNFLLIGITSAETIVFTEYINGQIIEQKGFNVSWYREKGVNIDTLHKDEFKEHECFNTFEKYLKEYGAHEFLGKIEDIPYIGIAFKIGNEFKSIYFDSSIGAVLTFSSEIVKSERLAKISEFFYLNYHKIRDRIIHQLYDQYKYFKEEVLDWELDEEEKLEYPDIDSAEEVRRLIEFESINFYEVKNGFKIQLDGSCSWDPEHGFTFRVNENLEIEEVYL